MNKKKRLFLIPRKDKRGNIMLGLIVFIMALGVMIAFISPINSFLDLAQQSDAMNCKGFIYNGDSSHVLSFNNTLHGGASGSPIACLTVKLYLPYLLLVFLIGGMSAVLGNKAESMFGFGGGSDQPY